MVAAGTRRDLIPRRLLAHPTVHRGAHPLRQRGGDNALFETAGRSLGP
jgi:hypothetical protein